jgi:TonB family protein
MTESAQAPSPFRSAELVVALALLAVCLAVGGSYWLLSSRDGAGAGPAAAVETRDAAAGGKDEERAALNSWKQKLQGDFTALDRERQLQAQRSELDRRRQENDAAAARLEQLRAAAAAAAAPKPQPAAAPAPPPPAMPVPVPLASAAKAEPAPMHEPLRTEASVDWKSCSRPQYPRVSMDMGEQGVTVLSFRLSEQGEVQHSSVSDSSGSQRLDDAALHALQQCRFKPATLDGTAVAATATVRFRWQLGR